MCVSDCVCVKGGTGRQGRGGGALFYYSSKYEEKPIGNGLQDKNAQRRGEALVGSYFMDEYNFPLRDIGRSRTH